MKQSWKTERGHAQSLSALARPPFYQSSTSGPSSWLLASALPWWLMLCFWNREQKQVSILETHIVKINWRCPWFEMNTSHNLLSSSSLGTPAWFFFPFSSGVIRISCARALVCAVPVMPPQVRGAICRATTSEPSVTGVAHYVHQDITCVVHLGEVHPNFRFVTSPLALLIDRIVLLIDRIVHVITGRGIGNGSVHALT